MSQHELPQSIVEYFYEDETTERGHRCGYCKSDNTNLSKGMWGHQVSCQDYQDLIDRGWRRSGKYLYKPTMNKTCCPPYTIKCGALNFKPSKSHKKVMKAVTKFLKDKKEDVKEESGASVTSGVDATGEEKVKKQEEAVESQQKLTKTVPEKTSSGPDPNKPPCRKAKLIRKEKWLQKHGAGSAEMQEPVKQNKTQGKSLEDFLSEHLPSAESVHKLECVLIKCDTSLPEFESTYEKSFELFCKYQRNVHKDKPEKLNKNRIKLVKIDADACDELLPTIFESHVLFAKYQMNVHHEQASECDFSQFKRFLVDTPLVFEKNAESPSTGWGSFHQQYYIDGKMVAVGVLDVLPDCVSSVYFFYDTDYSFLSPGVYSALRELQFTRELNKSSSRLKYYYMGFYIHSCPKMSYKGKYYPSYIACPETFSWVPMEKCSPKLDVSKYSRLDETDKEDPDVDINKALILLKRRGMMPYTRYKSLRRGENDEHEVRQYAQLVGPKVAPRMALYRS